jgi:KRAB domain-containing zinc finger protein
MHIGVHTGDKQHKCDQCMKSFSRKQHLDMHIRVHTGVKPHKCDQCMKAFS